MHQLRLGAHANMGHLHIASRPALAQRIAMIAAQWTEIDTQLGAVFAVILAAEAIPAMTIYTALNSAGARIDALRAIGKSRLRERSFERLELLLKEFRKQSGQRDRLIHGLWGISDDYPDTFLVGDPREFLVWQTERAVAKATKASFDDQKHVRNRPQLLVYNEKDLIEIQTELANFHGQLGRFSLGLQVSALRHSGADSPRGP